MCVNYCINKNNFTVNVKKIEQKILNTQKRIYNASKKCDTNKVHEIQNYFLKHLDHQFLFIKLIVRQILKKNFLINDYSWKIIIYLYICINIKTTSSITIHFVKEKVKQYIFFLLLQPEWKARSENILSIRQHKIYPKKIKIESIFKNCKKICKSINQVYVDINISIKSINNKYLIDKINNIKNISNKLNLWLNSQNLFDYSYKKRSINDYQNENHLYKLLQDILYTGIKWHIYINLKTQKIYKKFILLSEKKLFFINHNKLSNLNIYIAMFIKKLNIDINLVKYANQKVFNQRINFTDVEILMQPSDSLKINLNNNSIKLLVSHIRYVLYHKNQLGQWRVNTYLTSTRAKLAIKKILFIWYKYYYYILDSVQISKINMIVSKIFYIWQKKK
uniref:hypothetical protein n=1 Tax=Phymatolithon calcareum TaxID=1277942 RepID=UPI0023F3C943|nr:hypothetical protein P6G74_pgp075 [Phymatolithon calcareum]WEA76799.1 hypothetical protein [Phymatolithon calcareum]